jgi:hypothetical protein
MEGNKEFLGFGNNPPTGSKSTGSPPLTVVSVLNESSSIVKNEAGMKIPAVVHYTLMHMRKFRKYV